MRLKARHAPLTVQKRAQEAQIPKPVGNLWFQHWLGGPTIKKWEKSNFILLFAFFWPLEFFFFCIFFSRRSTKRIQGWSTLITRLQAGGARGWWIGPRLLLIATMGGSEPFPAEHTSFTKKKLYFKTTLIHPIFFGNSFFLLKMSWKKFLDKMFFHLTKLYLSNDFCLNFSLTFSFTPAVRPM